MKKPAWVRRRSVDKLFVSFSGGRSSGYMAQRLSKEYRTRYEMIFGFANTGEEWEKTLIFTDRCDHEFGLDLVWLEAVVHHGERIGCTHRIVNLATASRNEEPFREVIAKYGIPNKAYPHCTRELKLNPIRSYLESIGWATGEYLTAVGIRADEPKRVREDAAEAHILYPMVHWFPTTKPEINAYWEGMPFQLGLEEHQGNCKTCWKKSTQKLVRIAKETPEAFGFNAEMEASFGLAGHNEDGTKRVFFRGHMSTKDLLEIAGVASIRPTPDDPDKDSGCSESCEAFGSL